MSTFYRELRSAIDANIAAEEGVMKARQLYYDSDLRVGKALRALREHKGLSLRACAKQINISAPFLSDVERGRRHPSDGTLELYINILIPSSSFNHG